jgi:hypothetical protein
MHRDPFSQRWQQQQQQQDQRSDPFNSSFPFGGDPFSESQWSRPAPGQGGFPPGYDPQQANDWLWTSEARRDYEARRARASEKMLNKIRLRLMVYVLFIAFIAVSCRRGHGWVVVMALTTSDLPWFPPPLLSVRPRRIARGKQESSNT